jgi:predicted  nucleic acid-binding Zn-ribbon protein
VGPLFNWNDVLPDLERLIQLQEIESRAAAANKVIADAPGRIAALDALLQSATSALATAKQALTDNQTHRRAIDKDLAAAQQRQDKYKEQVMAVKTNEQLHACRRRSRPSAKKWASRKSAFSSA